MALSQRSVVCLLRQAVPPDPYEAALEAAGFIPYSLPVLSFTFVQEGALRVALARPDAYGGLIFTSPRAVDACAEALAWLPGQLLAWEQKPAFAVGPRTAEALRTLGFTPRGEACGRGSALAELIVSERYDGPLLFLCGRRHREELPARLRDAGVPFEMLAVYDARPIGTLDFSPHPAPDWVVFFSPSGVKAAQNARGIEWDRVRKAAIGPTTAEALAEAGWTAAAVARAPEPVALAGALRSAAST